MSSTFCACGTSAMVSCCLHLDQLRNLGKPLMHQYLTNLLSDLARFRLRHRDGLLQHFTRLLANDCVASVPILPDLCMTFFNAVVTGCICVTSGVPTGLEEVLGDCCSHGCLLHVWCRQWWQLSDGRQVTDRPASAGPQQARDLSSTLARHPTGAVCCPARHKSPNDSPTFGTPHH